MPFDKGSMPPRLRGKGIPQSFADQWIEVWNSVFDRTHDEGRAYQQANGVLRRRLLAAGYRKDEDGVWSKEEADMGKRYAVTETWLPSGTSENDLDDGDFAWLSDAYRKASPEEQDKMNKRANRKLPFKVHGKVDRNGWKAAWKAAAHPGARHPDMSGGPSQEEVLATLRRYKPAGITIDKEDTFTDAHGEDLIGFSRPLVVLEQSDAGMRVKGVALVDEAVSKNRRYYSPRFNDAAAEETNQWMAKGNMVTLYSRHAKAIPPDGASRDLPVGQVVKPLAREGGEIVYEAVIAPTADGRDVMALLQTFKQLPTSIRSTDYDSRLVDMNGVQVEEMLRAVICGIDFTDEPGIEGAGVKEILEEAPTIEVEEEVEDMEMSALTLEVLEQERKDLLEAHATAVLEPLRAAMQEQAKRQADLEAANAALAAKVTALEASLGAAGLQAKIAEAALIGNLEKAVFEELRTTVKTEAELPKAVAAARDKAFIAYAAGVSSGDAKGGHAKGTSGANTPAEESKGETGAEGEVREDLAADESLTEEFQRILKLAGAKPRTAVTE